MPYKEHADNLDAFVYMVLVDADGRRTTTMREFLYRDRTKLAVYAKAMFGLALHKQSEQAEKLAMILKNIAQFVVQDDENQTAYLKLPADNYWWYWYGSEIEANAYYLKLLAATDPKGETASRLVKYLLNNRKHATYWNSTRDTAIVHRGDGRLPQGQRRGQAGHDGRGLARRQEAEGGRRSTPTNLFTFDNKFVLDGRRASTDGKHTRRDRARRGTGPVYFNAYLTNFTLEDYITKAGPGGEGRTASSTS